MKLKLITECDFNSTEYESELCEETSSKNMFIKSITLQSNVQNRNGRIYPEEVLDEAVQKYMDDTNSMGMTMEGCLQHPKTNAHEVDETKISHRFTELVKNGNNWHSKALILETPNGKIVKNLIDGGVKLGISSRCLGQMKNNVVQSGLKIITPGDIVRRPSAPDALVSAIYENKEWVYENGVLIEKDLSEEIDTYKKMISKTTKNDRSKIFEKIILDYMNKLEIG